MKLLGGIVGVLFFFFFPPQPRGENGMEATRIHSQASAYGIYLFLHACRPARSGAGLRYYV